MLQFIRLNTHLTDIGKLVYTGSLDGTKTIPSNRDVELFRYEGEVGAVYLVVGTVLYSTASSTGVRQMYIASLNHEGFEYFTPGTCNVVTGCVPFVIGSDDGKIINLTTYQTSGVALDVTSAYIRVYRLS